MVIVMMVMTSVLSVMTLPELPGTAFNSANHLLDGLSFLEPPDPTLGCLLWSVALLFSSGALSRNPAPALCDVLYSLSLSKLVLSYNLSSVLLQKSHNWTLVLGPLEFQTGQTPPWMTSWHLDLNLFPPRSCCSQLQLHQAPQLTFSLPCFLPT